VNSIKIALCTLYAIAAIKFEPWVRVTPETSHSPEYITPRQHIQKALIR
jgi:hypothetical protein